MLQFIQCHVYIEYCTSYTATQNGYVNMCIYIHVCRCIHVHVCRCIHVYIILPSLHSRKCEGMEILECAEQQ